MLSEADVSSAQTLEKTADPKFVQICMNMCYSNLRKD